MLSNKNKAGFNAFMKKCIKKLLCLNDCILHDCGLEMSSLSYNKACYIPFYSMLLKLRVCLLCHIHVSI